MKMQTSVIVLAIVGVAVLSGCGTMRWSGHYKHSDANPQLHHDWQSQPDFPSTSGSIKTEPLLPAFPKTEEEHRAAARKYREKAARYRAEALDHKTTEGSYRMQKDRSIAVHCDRLAQDLESAAQEMEKLAAWHDAKGSEGNK